MTIFTCEDHFDAMMTCVYEAWASRLGHSNVKLKTEPIGNLELFCNYRHVDTDSEKTARVIRSIKSKISYQAYLMIYEAAMSDAEDKLDIDLSIYCCWISLWSACCGFSSRTCDHADV